MLTLVLLSTALFTRRSKVHSTDEESASLLTPSKRQADDKKTSVGKSSYGSITITSHGEGADLEWEAEQRKKEHERMKVLEKRLEAEGNWYRCGPRPEIPIDLT